MVNNIIFIFIIGFLTYVVYSLSKIKELKKENEIIKDKNIKIVSQKKSSEVRLGRIGENMAPFFNEWPYEPTNFRFLGNPVDGVSFNDDEIVFVEIKTGKARLTNSQKKAKQLIKEGKVKFVTFRVGEEGCDLKIEEIIDFKDNSDTLIKLDNSEVNTL